MSRLSALYLAGGATLASLALVLPTAVSFAKGPAPITISKMGSFQTEGQVVASDDGKQTLHCDHGYVGYTVPVNARKVGLFLWHSSSAHVWENRWDGGEGYQSILLRNGYSTYVWDGPRVGRGNMGCENYDAKPRIGQDQGNWIAWRFGPKPGEWFPGVQFPTASKEAYDQAMAARYQEFDIAKNAHLEATQGAKAADRIGPVVALTNSAGDWRAMLAAMQSANFKGVVAYEPAAFIFPDGEGPDGPEGGFGPTHVPMSEFMKLTKIPIQIVWGDNTDKTTWKAQVATSRQMVDLINKHGGKAEVLMLSDVGLRGNTHIPFADMNNQLVAQQLFKFLAKHGLDKR